MPDTLTRLVLVTTSTLMLTSCSAWILGNNEQVEPEPAATADPQPDPQPGVDDDGGAPDDGGVEPDVNADGGEPSPAPDVDGGPGTDAGASDAGVVDAGPPAEVDLCDVVETLFVPYCVACHQPGQTAPDLTLEGARTSLVGQASTLFADAIYVVPGDLGASLLYRKLWGTQSATEGAVMPLGLNPDGAPMDAADIVEQWILEGATTTCDDEVDPTEPAWEPGANALDQGTLFTCVDPNAARSSPARLRRLERREWTRAVGRTLAPRAGSSARNNPLHAPGHLGYSTYDKDVTVDAATLDLYFAVLPEAGSGWVERDNYRTYASYNDSALRCMWDDTSPDDVCIDYFLEKYLAEGVLFRQPSTGELQRLKDFTLSQLALETSVDDRTDTMQQVTNAAWLSAGALFRRELGDGVVDEFGRRRLSDGELGRSLGGVLSTHPPGASGVFDWMGGPPEHVNWTAPPEGHLGDVATAMRDGTIQDSAVRQTLLRQYVGGEDADRYDLQREADRDRRALRGDFYLSARVGDFFREWLDYEGVPLIFKDTPRATTQWDGDYTGNPMYDPISLAWGNLMNHGYGDESTLVEQLDDTIAKVVLDDTDVFRTLLTTRHWRLPSNLGQTNTQTCTTSGDCTEAGYAKCTSIGLCGNSISSSTTDVVKPYNLTSNVPATDEARWVDMNPAERAGVLTHPAWLGAHGGNFEDDASAIHRGKWIRERLLCEVVPPLELVQVEAQLVPSAPDKSARDRIVESIENNADAATCMGCHTKMNSLGFPFEMYNHAGFIRATDHGDVDSTAVIDNAPDATLNTSVTSAVQLSELLGDSAHAKRCFIRQSFRFFMGRDETAADSCLLDAMEQSYDSSGGSFITMLETLVSSDEFVYRHDVDDDATSEGGQP